MTAKKVSFILASASPQRRELLTKAGYVFDVVPSGVDEDAYPTADICPMEHTMVLAKAKAFSVARENPDRLVVGSDCVVELDGEIIGKPDDAEHAEQIIRKLFAKPHRVITGVAFIHINKGIEEVICDVTTVYPRSLREEQIRKHIESGQWKGRAGAYGIQDCSDEFVDHIEGSFSNVIGLPMEKTTGMLDKLLCD